LLAGLIDEVGLAEFDQHASGSQCSTVVARCSTTSKSVGAGMAVIPKGRKVAKALGMCRAEVTRKRLRKINFIVATVHSKGYELRSDSASDYRPQ